MSGCPHISRRSFFDVWFANAKESRQDALLHYILQELSVQSVTDDILKSLKATISRVSQKIDERTLMFHYLEQVNVPEDHRKTLNYPVKKQRNGEFVIFLKLCVQKRYRWQTKYSFANQEKGTQQLLLRSFPCFHPEEERK